MFSWMRKSRDGHKNGQQLPDSVSVSCRYRANKRQPRQGNWPGQRSHTHSGRPTGPPGAQEHSHGDGPLLKVVCVWYRSHNIIRHGPHTCRRTTRTALDEAIIPVVILSTVNNRDQVAHQDPPIKDRSPDIEVMTLVFCPTRHCLRWRLPMEFAWKSIWDTQNIDVETCRLRPVTSQCTKWWFPTAACVWTSLVQWNVLNIGCQGQTSAHCHRR